jgi:dTDP-4-amino-4,6-dideoxygalactose transaminase
MAVPFLDLKAQYASIKDEVGPAMQKVLDEATYALGPAVLAFEKDFAAYCGAKHCVGLNSGTAAIALLLQAHGIGPGDEVITVANSFFASAEGISEIGATPVLVDCREDTALLDPALLERAITPKTKAILAVHLYGQPADMHAILAIARPRNILVFEDAAQAHGALYKGRKAGGLADGACFSFYPGKNLGAYGEAGAVTTNDDAVAEKIRMLREHGMTVKYHHDAVGWNERMDGLQGAVLGVKLKHLDGWNARRRAHMETYRAHLPATVRMIAQSPDTQSCWHLLVVRVPDRDKVLAGLTAAGIGTGIHYPVPIHLQPAYAGRWKPGDFPNAERLAGEILSLPLYAEMTEEMVREVCEAMRRAS